MSHGLAFADVLNPPLSDDEMWDKYGHIVSKDIGIDKQERHQKRMVTAHLTKCSDEKWQPSSEDYFDNWIDPVPRHHSQKWERVKREARDRHYEQVNLYRVAVDSHKLRGDLRVALQKTNEWLHKHSLIGYPDSPVNIFINFFKKEVRGDRTIDKVIRANSVNIDASRGYISHLSFYDTYWPTYAMGFYRELSTVAKGLDFDALKVGETTTTEGIVVGASIKELMSGGLSRLANYTF